MSEEKDIKPGDVWQIDGATYRVGWEAHLDRVHPSCSPLEHARVDAPGLFIAGGVVVGALGGWKGAGIGAVVGGVLGSILLAVPAKRGRG